MSDFLIYIYIKNQNPILVELPKYIMQYLFTAWENKGPLTVVMGITVYRCL